MKFILLFGALEAILGVQSWSPPLSDYVVRNVEIGEAHHTYVKVVSQLHIIHRASPLGLNCTLGL